MRQITEEDKRIGKIVLDAMKRRKKLALEQELHRRRFMDQFVKDYAPPPNPERDAWLAHYEMTYYDFKPEFGNVQHIKALEMIAVLNKNLDLLDQKERSARGAGMLRTKIRKQYEELDTYLSFIKKEK